MLSGVGDERIHRRHCFYMAGRREWRNSAAGRVWWGALEPGACASYPGKPYSSVEGRKPFAGERRRRPCEFAPHPPESLIPSLRGANLLPGKGAGGRVSLRPIPGKALFHRRGAQTNCREKAPAAVGVCASHPGKPYFSVERRKLFAGERRRRLWEFAPHTPESLILPSRGANLSPAARSPSGTRT